MNWIAILFAAELGIMPIGNLKIYEPAPYNSVETAGSFYADFGIRAVLWETLYAGGSMKNYFSKFSDSYLFNPEMTNFLFEAGLQWKGFEVGFRHYCAHPYAPVLGTSVEELIWEGGYEEFFVRFEAQIGGKH
jgi:hypothetical protein